MTYRTALLGLTPLVLALGSPALADVTPQEVWDNWKNAAAAAGQTITPGNTADDGRTLTLSDVAIAMDTPEMRLNGTVPEIAFADNGDGTVTITMSPSYEMTLDFGTDDTEDGTITLEAIQNGMEMTASGTPDEVTYDFVATEAGIRVANLTIEGQSVEMLAELMLNDVDGTYRVTGGDAPSMDAAINGSSMTIDFDMNEPEGGDGKFVAKMNYADVAMASQGSMFMMADLESMAQMLRNGMASATKISHGAADFMVDFQDGSDAFALSGTTSSGSWDVAISEDGMRYATTNSDLAMVMSGSEIPLPEVAVEFGTLGFLFDVPVSASEEPQDFAFNVTLANFSVSEMIWSMVDPGGALPHDPATFIVDITGQANWLFDILDPEGQAEAMGAMPGELHALDINDLTVDVAGAKLTGVGAFTFDNENLETFDGIPAPTGAIDLTLVGGNGLLDKLVAMGLLPEDQAMGARMMLGLFARPGDGPDTLVSKIEVDGATGAVSANGQRLQ